MGVGGGPVCVLPPVLGAVAGIGRGDMGSFSPCQKIGSEDRGGGRSQEGERHIQDRSV